MESIDKGLYDRIKFNLKQDTVDHNKLILERIVELMELIAKQRKKQRSLIIPVSKEVIRDYTNKLTKK